MYYYNYVLATLLNAWSENFYCSNASFYLYRSIGVLCSNEPGAFYHCKYCIIHAKVDHFVMSSLMCELSVEIYATHHISDIYWEILNLNLGMSTTGWYQIYYPKFYAWLQCEKQIVHNIYVVVDSHKCESLTAIFYYSSSSP